MLSWFQMRRQISRVGILAQSASDCHARLERPAQKGTFRIAAVDDHPQRFASIFHGCGDPFDQPRHQDEFGGESPAASFGDGGYRLFADLEHRSQGNANAPHFGYRSAKDSATQTCPYRQAESAGPGVGL